MTRTEMEKNKSFCEKQISWHNEQIAYYREKLEKLSAEIKEARERDNETDRRYRDAFGITDSEKKYISAEQAELLRDRQRTYSAIKSTQKVIKDLERAAKTWARMIEEEAKQTEEDTTENTDTTTEEAKEAHTMTTNNETTTTTNTQEKENTNMSNNTIFPKLREEVKADTARRESDIFFYIENGYFPSWAEQHRNDRERGLKQYSTATRWEQYKAGKISREKAVELAQKRAAKEVESRREKRLARLDEAEKAPAISSGSVSVEWKKNSTWGANPTALFLSIGQGETSGRASGCGYDKESAAIAEAFNNSPSALRVLYELGEDALTRGESPKSKTAASGYSWGSCIGYGAGYDVLPYWEGGVGSDCFWRILEKAGYKIRKAGSGKMFDCYTISREG